ncbi:MAG: hypothetical protein JWQ51_3482, partial [Tardiphaga sp.]|nr:hypothetical protein [Tardiphaga sp.]
HLIVGQANRGFEVHLFGQQMD